MSKPKLEQWHVTWASVGRLPVAPEEARRAHLARELPARCRKALVLFAIVDDHVHVWLYGTREELVRAVRAVGFLLRGAAATTMEEPFIEEVRRRDHVESLFPYLLTQPDHHALGVHPATWSGLATADLLGARDLGWTSRIWDVLPGLGRRDVHAVVGLPDVELVPADNAVIAARGVERLVASAAAAFAADLSTRSEASLLAVRVAAHLAREAGLRQKEMVAATGRSRITLWRVDPEQLPAKAIRTVRLRVALEVAAATARVPQRAPPPEALGANRPPVARPGRRPPRRRESSLMG